MLYKYFLLIFLYLINYNRKINLNCWVVDRLRINKSIWLKTYLTLLFKNLKFIIIKEIVFYKENKILCSRQNIAIRGHSDSGKLMVNQTDENNEEKLEKFYGTEFMVTHNLNLFLKREVLLKTQVRRSKTISSSREIICNSFLPIYWKHS